MRVISPLVGFWYFTYSDRLCDGNTSCRFSTDWLVQYIQVCVRVRRRDGWETTAVNGSNESEPESCFETMATLRGSRLCSIDRVQIQTDMYTLVSSSTSLVDYRVRPVLRVSSLCFIRGVAKHITELQFDSNQISKISIRFAYSVSALVTMLYVICLEYVNIVYFCSFFFLLFFFYRFTTRQISHRRTWHLAIRGSKCVVSLFH